MNKNLYQTQLQSLFGKIKRLSAGSGSQIGCIEFQLLQQLFMIEPREPRQPRPSPHIYINIPQYIEVDIEFDHDIHQLPKRLHSKLKKVQYKGNLKFHGDEWQVFGMPDIAPHIVRWGIPKGLHIQYSKQPNLLVQICNIDFTSLTHMNLTSSMIQSIQPICSMMLPNLQRIVLSSNKITCVRSLRKANFPNLTSCSLGGNKILEYSSLSQLHAPVLRSVTQENRSDSGWGDTFTWIGKLQTNQLQRLWIRSDHRIWQKSAQRSFEQKYMKRKQITFYVGLVGAE